MQLPLWPPDAKRCCGCDQVKPLTDFNRRRKARDGRQSYCRECNRRWHAENRERHNTMIRARTRRVKAELQQRLLYYLRDKCCADCSEGDVRVLEFDHLRDKRAEVSVLMNYGSWPNVLAEIEKCDIVCANCHRRRTYARSRSYRDRLA